MPPIDAGDTQAAGSVAWGDWVIKEPVVAAVAVHAAQAVPGVVRLEPGLLGLVGSLARSASQRISGLDPAPTAGVRVSFERTLGAPPDQRVSLEVDMVTSGQDQAAAVAQAVQRAVSRAVTAATGLTVTGVTVSILEIELAGTELG